MALSSSAATGANLAAGSYYIAKGQLGSAAYVTDNIYDNGNDKNTQLGDVNPDTFSYADAGASFVGQFKASNGTNFVGIYQHPLNQAANANAGKLYLYTNKRYDPGVISGFSTKTTEPICYASGTLIRTARGDVAVEDLKVGDLAVTASGARRPIRWLGHRTYDCRRAAGPRSVRPVRVAAHAFGPNLPTTDLILSPGHSVCVNVIDDVLIPIQELVNGSTIAYAPMDVVTYWHVELDSHDILIANNLPAESFLEMGANRACLDDHASADLPIEVLDRTHADFCRRFVDGGPLLAVVREELARRADDLGWAPSRAVEIEGIVGGRTIKPLLLGGEAVMALPADVGRERQDVAIRSCLTTPTLMGEADPRGLGLAVYGLSVATESGETRALDLDAPELRGCFHPGERDDGLHYRWTSGDLVIPATMIADLAGPLMLRLSYEPTTVRGWTAPAAMTPRLRLIA